MIDHVFERRDLSLFRIFPLSEPRRRLPEGATLGWLGWLLPTARLLTT